MTTEVQSRTVKIVSRWNAERVLFQWEAPEGLESGLWLRHALEAATGSDADLSGADLSDADLRDADLRGAVLSDADLSGADLSDADLRDADLRGAVLSDAVLSGAVLRDADLSGADLSGAVLRGAVLRGAVLSGADLRGADLRGAVLSDADLSENGVALRSTPQEAIENLDKVRAIVLDNAERLNMGHWHGDSGWKDRTCAEETLCGTTHCMAGWLQVCSTKPGIRAMYDTELAGILAAPVAAKMFFRENADALKWLQNRAYVTDLGIVETPAAS